MKKQQNVSEKVDRQTLAHALQIAKRIVPTRPLNEIYRNIYIGNKKLEAQDGEIFVEIPTDYCGTELLIPADRLHALVTSINTESITIEGGGSQANIRASRGHWKLPTASTESWDAQSKANVEPVCSVPADQLARAIQAVIDAADKQTISRLSGILLDLKDGVIHFVATDGRRLHVSEVEIEQATDDCKVVVPLRAANLVSYLAGQAGDEYSVQIDRNASDVIFTIGSPATVVRARQLDSRFPDWTQVVPKKHANAIVVQSDKLCSSIKQAAICTSEESKSIVIKWGETTEISSNSSANGKSKVFLEPQRCDTEEITTINPAFCNDFLRHLEPCEPVDIEFGKAGSLVLRNEDCTAVIMPMEVGAA